MHVDVGGNRVAPFTHIGLSGLHQLVECLAIETRVSRRTHRAFVLRRRRAGRIIGKARKHVPACTVFVAKAECRSEIVDAGSAPVGTVTGFAHPEEVLFGHEFGQRAAILALGRFGHLFAE